MSLSFSDLMFKTNHVKPEHIYEFLGKSGMFELSCIGGQYKSVDFCDYYVLNNESLDIKKLLPGTQEIFTQTNLSMEEGNIDVHKNEYFMDDTHNIYLYDAFFISLHIFNNYFVYYENMNAVASNIFALNQQFSLDMLSMKDFTEKFQIIPIKEITAEQTYQIAQHIININKLMNFFDIIDPINGHENFTKYSKYRFQTEIPSSHVNEVLQDVLPKCILLLIKTFIS